MATHAGLAIYNATSDILHDRPSPHLFIWLMNGDRILDISVIAHFINAVTNPLGFLVRSYHMGVFTLQFFLLPLIVIGLESIISLAEKSSASTHS